MNRAALGGEVSGDVPDLGGLVCEAFLCQSYWYEGREVEPANVVYLQFGSVWRRLYMDRGIVFWRPQDGPPEPHDAASEGCSYPVVDVGLAASVIGVRLDYLEMAWSDSEAAVTFRFANRSSVIITCGYTEDVTTYRIV
jgi:hypothetical protein